MPKTKVQQCYMICATPRTGSTLLIQALRDTDLCGKPNEYFIPRTIKKKSQSWNIPENDFQHYLRQLFARTATKNGVFGFKVMHNAYNRVIRDLRKVSKDGESPETELLTQYFPNLKYIYIKRNDKIRQAISIIKAKQSNVWHSTQTNRKLQPDKLVFDKQQIDQAVNDIVQGEEAWEETFRKNNLEPYRIVYEDFSASYKPTILDVLGYLNIPIQPHEIKEMPVLKKLADNTSESWYVRCLREIGEMSEAEYLDSWAELHSL